MTLTPDGILHVPARDLPLPASLSEQARHNAVNFPPISIAPWPSHRDPAAWHDFLAQEEAKLLGMFRSLPAADDLDVTGVQIGATTVWQYRPATPKISGHRVYLDIHGGALVLGRGESCRLMGQLTASRRGVETWSPDYRMPPEHAYPAALDDCLATYRALLAIHRPENIVIGGVSAGGNLAAATILRARDEGLPLPAGCVLGTPEIDLTESGDSFRTNLGVDNCLQQSLMEANLLYAAGRDLDHPYLSPLYADFSGGFPPTLIYAGTRDLFLSNAVRMHWALRAADVPADLYILEAGTHVGHQGAPEGDALEREIDRFCARVWRV